MTPTVTATVTQTPEERIFITPTPTHTPQPPLCTEADVKPSLLSLDQNAAKLLNAIVRSTKVATNNKALSRSKGQQYRINADKLFKNVWTLVWTVPVKVVNCTGGRSCTVVSFEPTLVEYEKNFEALRQLVDRLAKDLKRSRNKTIKRKAKELANLSSSTRTESNRLSQDLPRSARVCI